MVVATTRPETIPGDVAIAVHPDDDRYSRYVGQYVKHPFKETYIPVIADDSVKINFGTGMLNQILNIDRNEKLMWKVNLLTNGELMFDNLDYTIIHISF